MSQPDRVHLHYEDLPNSVSLVGDIAIDTEAMGLNIHRDRLCLVQLRDSSSATHLIAFRSDSSYKAPNLCAYLQNPSHQKIFHFARFDVAIMKHYLGVGKVNNVFCTKIASKLARTYTDHHGLRSIANELLGVDIKKDQQSSDWGADVITDAQKRYAVSDVLYLHMLRDKLKVMLEREGRMAFAADCFAFIDTVTDLDLIGFSSDLFAH